MPATGEAAATSYGAGWCPATGKARFLRLLRRYGVLFCTVPASAAAYSGGIVGEAKTGSRRLGEAMFSARRREEVIVVGREADRFKAAFFSTRR